ncbi:MAG: hypothetical protein NZ846_07825 [Thermus sp.]|uniref:hypothetical protein n=1 Tax=Thermus sp. TaxID=275 RepID=UPI0025FAD8D8|nr:hypothetical protein [Thermus sp.]MCS6867499.1 hypothetical protein [Thermus sp.]MCS7218867.1 hypothetical protein [Thermus sp.]MDW8016417.1 hypothetical protein [Thermus sp.]MDW8357851.1 hypothetical protein [Thermus sp.]
MKEEKPFYTLSAEGRTFAFRRPDISQVDRFASRMARAPLSSALDFTRELSLDPEAWAQATAEKPGLALTAASELLEALGFRLG